MDRRKLLLLGGKSDPDLFWVPEFTTPDVEGVTFGGFWAGRFIASQPGAFNAAGGDKPLVADNAAVGTNVPWAIGDGVEMVNDDGTLSPIGAWYAGYPPP